MSQPVTPYQMAVNNVARHIRSQDIEEGKHEPLINAFQCSTILAIAFCKIEEEVLMDIVSAKV